MKKILNVIGLVLLNLGLIYLALRIHYGKTQPIIRTTDAPIGIETMFFIPILLVALVLFSINKKFRRFGIGLTAFCISIIIFLIFYLNKSFATEGDYESFKLREANWIDNEYYLNIEYNKWYNSTEVTQEKCLKVDSVQVRIDKGLFGMQTMSNNVRIVESSNCEHDNLDTADLKKSNLTIGHDLAQKRCFSAAIHHYSNCIKLNSLEPDCYYHRGLMYMVIEEYNNALVDFLTSASLKYNELDNKTIEFIDNAEIVSYTNELLDKLYNKINDDLGEYIHNISTINDFETYQKRIEFCIEKLKNK